MSDFDATKREMSWRSVGIISALMVFGFLAFVFFPSFVKLHDPESQRHHACIANLKAMEGSKATWALEYQKITNDVPADADLFGYDKYMRDKPVCAAGGTYTVGPAGEKPRCSIPGHTI